MSPLRTEMTEERRELIEDFQELILDTPRFNEYIKSLVEPQVEHFQASILPNHLPKAVRDELFCQYQVIEINRFIRDLMM